VVALKYDIVIVTHNSTEWLQGCFSALSRLDYDKQELHIIVVDNNSAFDTQKTLVYLQEKYKMFGAFDILVQKKNYGFGKACNIGAKAGNAPYIFMLNVDTKIEPDALKEMDIAIRRDEYGICGAFEMRQKPVEMGRHNDPATMECSWNSGACVVYRREVYENLGGFDENMFMYCEDVDLSWRIRASGYKLIYVPRSGVFHYTRRNDNKKEFQEYIFTTYNRLMMRYKYGDLKDRKDGRREYIHAIKMPRYFPFVRRVLLKNYIKHYFNIWPFYSWRFKNRDLVKRIPSTYIEGFEIMRNLYQFEPLRETPLVSIIIRTSNRPDVLRLTLQALRHQTYRNFEVIVQEDGSADARKMIEEEFGDLKIYYEATGEKVGRSKVGNLALARAKGEFFNFLDDDDFLYPEHIELMLASFEKYPDADFIVNGYMLFKQDTISISPYHFTVKAREYHAPARLDILTMCKQDQIPILSAMFRRHLYVKMGGLREDIDSNEDWGMWLRFLTLKPKYYTNNRATCAFVFPADNGEVDERIRSYRVNYDKVFEDKDLVFEFTARELNKMYNDNLVDMKNLVESGGINGFLNDNLAY